MAIIVDKGFNTSTTLTDASNFPDGVTDIDGDLTIGAAGAYGGTTYGLIAAINDTDYCMGNILFSAPASNTLRARFYVNPNGMTGNNYDIIVSCHIRSSFGGSQHVAAIRVDRRATGFIFTLSSVDDAGGQVSTESNTLPDAWHCIEFQVTRATNNGSGDGFYQLWVDGISIGTQTTIDNYDNFNGISGISVGGITRTGIIAGTMYVDQLVVNDDGSEIGAMTENFTYDTKLRIPADALATTAVAATADYTCGANAKLLVVMVCWDGQTGRTGGAPTYDGDELTQAESRQGVTETSVEMWYMLSPPVGSALEINVPNDGGLTMWVYVASANGTAGYNPELDDTGVNATTAANPNVTVTPTVDSTIIFAVVGTGDSTFAHTARTGTSLYEEDIAAYGSGAQYFYRITAGAQILSWTDSTSDDYGAIGAAFKLVEAGEIVGTTCWGHVTGVTETNVQTFAGNWTGDGAISGAGDGETICLNAGEYMESEVVNTGDMYVELSQNVYAAGDTIAIKYRTGATVVACQAEGWTAYTVPFLSLGYSQVRIESTL